MVLGCAYVCALSAPGLGVFKAYFVEVHFYLIPLGAAFGYCFNRITVKPLNQEYPPGQEVEQEWHQRRLRTVFIMAIAAGSNRSNWGL